MNYLHMSGGGALVAGRPRVWKNTCSKVFFVIIIWWAYSYVGRLAIGKTAYPRQGHGVAMSVFDTKKVPSQAVLQKQNEDKAMRERKRLEDEAEQERIRKQTQHEAEQQLKLEEEAALLKAREKAKRRLNRFEERRVRRRVRSKFIGSMQLPGLEAWNHVLKPGVKAQLDDAVKFFSETMRVPATLIGSAALGSLFLQPWAFDDERHPSSHFRLLRRLYLILTTITFSCELTAVLMTSNAHAQLLELGRDELVLEPTPMDLIMSHIEFEYLTCSLSFNGGLACFMLATLCRVLAVFKFSKTLKAPKDPRLSAAIGGIIVSILLWWIHLINVRLTEFENLGHMVIRFFQLLFARIRVGTVGPVGYLSFSIAICSALEVLKSVSQIGREV